ncbi:MAG: 4-demethylwyosine synthase TYW1 [Candidatus Marsarchaeota archaeon]|jgi:tRNA wybutosine-synthesizing protein 1|nr:4-demethylwyosine synthase TYW1 [Candidatus Marsarchaeota archaeon]
MPGKQVVAVDMLEKEQTPNLPDELGRMMKKQGYHFVGRHSATKICNYTSDSLKGGESCYKHRFYGIRSWRCIQATPAIGCNLACTFCWRIIPEEEGFKWNELNAGGRWDDPDKIVEGLINEHKRIITGYKGNEKVDMKRWDESNDPAHVALSLTGEPLFYPKMNRLLEAFHEKGISTFLVTNGTMLGALQALEVMPTQLYVSIQAPNKELYGKITRPKNLTATWDNFIKFLELFSHLQTRRVFRLTSVKGLNMEDAEGYARLISIGKPHYVEVKGFSYVGGARNKLRGLSYEQMPRKESILEFAGLIAEKSGYIVVDYHEHSNVALLCADKAAAAARIIKFQK